MKNECIQKNKILLLNISFRFVRMEICRPQSDNTRYVVLTHWQDESAFKNWVGSDDFKMAHQNPMNK